MPNIDFPREEGRTWYTTWWPHPTESAVCQCTGRPPQINPTEKKKHYSPWLLSVTCTWVTTSTKTTKLAASANKVNGTVSSSTTNGTAETPLKEVEQTSWWRGVKNTLWQYKCATNGKLLARKRKRFKTQKQRNNEDGTQSIAKVSDNSITVTAKNSVDYIFVLFFCHISFRPFVLRA